MVQTESLREKINFYPTVIRTDKPADRPSTINSIARWLICARKPVVKISVVVSNGMVQQFLTANRETVPIIFVCDNAFRTNQLIEYILSFHHRSHPDIVLESHGRRDPAERDLRNIVVFDMNPCGTGTADLVGFRRAQDRHQDNAVTFVRTVRFRGQVQSRFGAPRCNRHDGRARRFRVIDQPEYRRTHDLSVAGNFHLDLQETR